MSLLSNLYFLGLSLKILVVFCLLFLRFASH